MRGLSIVVCMITLFTASCSNNDSKISSEPAGKFEAGVPLTEAQSKPFSLCGVDTLSQALALKCSVVPNTQQSQIDEVISGMYTFTVNDVVVTSVRLQRTIKAEVVCIDMNDKPVSKGMAVQTTTVIYANSNQTNTELSSCSEATPVWIKSTLELENGELLEETTRQLIDTL